MIEVFIITTGFVVSVALLVFKGIKITIDHNNTHKDLTPHAPVVPEKSMTEEEFKKFMEEQDKIPTMDAMVKAVQEAIGGALDG